MHDFCWPINQVKGWWVKLPEDEKENVSFFSVSVLLTVRSMQVLRNHPKIFLIIWIRGVSGSIIYLKEN
jgi:hypothetical protein